MLELSTRDQIFLEKNAFFPVIETPVFHKHPHYTDEVTAQAKDFKGIFRTDTQELISIHKKSYKMIENKVLVQDLLQILEKTDQKCYLDFSHTYSNTKRMRLQVKFPELFLRDKESDQKGSNIPISLFVHNSYDGSEGVRLIWGAIRGICSNGMIFGKVEGQMYHRHTSGMQISAAVGSFNKMVKKLPEVQERINLLEQTSFKEEDKEWVKNEFSKACYKDMNIEKVDNLSAWQFLNLLTFWVSHNKKVEQRYSYQRKIQNHFQM